jgi:outer membrane lipoprotein-sorting protein
LGQSKGESKEQTRWYTAVITRPGSKPVEFKTWIKEPKWRFEEMVEGKIVRIAIVSRGWFYQLYPEAKKGVKQKIPQDRHLLELLDPLNPFFKYAQKKGAKKIGSEKLNGRECDVYDLSLRKTKVWVRRKEGWIVKEEGEDGLGRFKTEVKNLQVGVPIDDSLFVLPEGYKLDEKQPSDK